MNGNNNGGICAKRRAGVLDRGACSLQPGPKRSKQVRSLSEDLIKLCILPRLPTKALLRFQCVSRSWHSLIISSNPYFIHLHVHSQSCISSSILVVYKKTRQCKFLEDFSRRGPRLSSLPFPNEMNRMSVSASCNGLLLCLKLGVGDVRKLYIGNPILRNWRLLPPHHHCHGDPDSTVFYGLAVDVEKSGVSYKLVLPERLTNEAIFNVLSSRSGQWEVSKYKLDVSKCIGWPPQGRATYLNGVLYWICDPQMLWFDIKDGRCGFFPLPPDKFFEYYECRGAVGVCNGKLTYTRVSYIESMGLGMTEIWSTADQSSPWTKIHSIWLHYSNASPMPFEGGNVVFFRVRGSLFSYDIKTCSTEYMPCTGHDFLPYKHCLTPLPSL